ncbi:MAG: hypothetical protein IJO54_06970 [Oscillospiraceae bacterium]|nr:hypothetical protein [Oscillospiraceae bacterium]
MKNSKGFIVLKREILDWEWYGDINTKVLFLHLLLCANHKPQRWRGIQLQRGQLITSLAHLAAETGLSVQSVRTALGKLKSTGEITLAPTNRYTLISVTGWDKYQSYEKEDTTPIITPTATPLADGQQAGNTLPTTDNNVTAKQCNNHIEQPPAVFVPPTKKQVQEYCDAMGYWVDSGRFVDFYQSKNWFVGKNKMNDWRAAVRSWHSRETDKGRNLIESCRPIPSGEDRLLQARGKVPQID